MPLQDTKSNQAIYLDLMSSAVPWLADKDEFWNHVFTLDLGTADDYDEQDLNDFADFTTDFCNTYLETYDDLDSSIPSKKWERKRSVLRLLANKLSDMDTFLDLKFLWEEAWSDTDKEAFVCAIDYDSSEFTFTKDRITKSRYTVMEGCDTYGSLDDESVLRDIGLWFATEEGLLEDWDNPLVRYFDTYAYGRDKHYEGYYEFVYLNSSNCWCYFETWA